MAFVQFSSATCRLKQRNLWTAWYESAEYVLLAKHGKVNVKWIMVKEHCWVLNACKWAFSDSCPNWKTKMSSVCLEFVFYFWNCCFCNAFSLFAGAFCRTVGKMFSKQKNNINHCKNVQRNSVLFASPAAKWYMVILSCSACKHYLAILSLSQWHKEGHRKVHRSWEVKKCKKSF